MNREATRIGRTPQLPPLVPQIELHDGESLVVYPLGDQPLTVGRSLDCSVQVERAFVSNRHLTIVPCDGGYQALDLQSTNGSFLNGQPLAPGRPTRLGDGDTLHLGAPNEPDAIWLIFRAARATQPGRVHALARAPLAIGRADADISLNHPLVSCEHARIEPDGAGHAIIDTNSTNGTFVNGRRVLRQRLRPGDTLQIGVFQLVYSGEQLAEYDQRGALRIEAQALTCCPSQAAQPILRDVSLAIEPRELVAVIGASGAGKSTLLALLAGHLAPDSGRVLLGGNDLAALRAAVGYLPQEEPLHRLLPAGRALEYTARLRLPPDTSPAEIRRSVAQSLHEVGLGGREGQPIAQMSGGQRKRAAIAAELIADPAMFVLDEPTAGLDPGRERRLFETLRALADAGRTVVVATHATASLALCDLVAILAEGRLVFYGPPRAALAFFGAADFAEIYEILSDEQVARGSRPEAGSVTQTRAAEGQATERSKPSPIINRRSPEAPPATSHQPPAAERPPSLWERRFRESVLHTEFVTARLRDAAEGLPADAAPSRPSFWRQLATIAERGIDLLRRDRRNLATLLAQAPALGLLLALVARPDALVGERAAANEAKKVLFLLAVTAVWCGVINAARAIAGEWAIVRRERLAGVRSGPYLLGKVATLLPLLTLQAAALLAGTALGVRFPPQGVWLPMPVELFVTTLLAGLAGTALGLAISAAASTPDRALSLVPLALIPQILFAGVIFNLGEGVGIQRTLSWLTAGRWAMDAYGASADLNALPLMPGMLRPLEPAAEYLATPAHLAARWLALILYAAFWLALAGALLRRQRDPA